MLLEEPSTIAAIATAPGRGAVSIVRVSGPDAFGVASAVCARRIDASLAGRFFFSGFHVPGSDRTIDSGLVLVFSGPRSYTGEDTVEFQGHGGAVASRRVLEACLAAGARLAGRGEFTRRAFLGGRLDLSEAEAVIDLVDARDERAADDALARLSGRLSVPFSAMYDEVLELSSRAEHALDFSEDELPPQYFAEIAHRARKLAGAIATHIATAREGRILREGALVVIAGEPNAGKSSLMNAMLGERRAIVSDVAGTTRDSIEESVEIEGWPVRLVDTAGIRVTDDSIEAEGVQRAADLMARADLVVRLIPPPSPLPASGPREIVVRSKCDLALSVDSTPLSLRVSAQTGEGLDELRRTIASCLSAAASRPDDACPADITTRQRDYLERAAAALASVDGVDDPVLVANGLRNCSYELGLMLGRTYSEDLLDSIFSRFCVGK